MNESRALYLQFTGVLTLTLAIAFSFGCLAYIAWPQLGMALALVPVLLLVSAVIISSWAVSFLKRASMNACAEEQHTNTHTLTSLDPLTRLPNRSFLKTSLERALQYAHSENSKFALLCIDLDRFKYINDSLGHAIGDQLLIEVAQRLSQNLGEYHTLSRLGGDEFGVLVEHLQHPEYAVQIAENLLQTAQMPYRLGEDEFSVTLSIGIALFPEDGGDADTLLKHADAAMYHAKAQGRNTSQLFTLDLHKRVRERLEIEGRLRHALKRNEISLHYQPQIDIASGQLMGCEALMRWENPQLGRIPPDKFIGIAEDSGLILQLGEWALLEACQQAMVWRNAGLPTLRMSVNVSALQFRHANLIKQVEQALHISGLPAEMLELELTESVLAENIDQIKNTLEQLKNLGVRLALDDFGTGYSSLSYLRQLRLDTLKIDRSFVSDLPNSEDCAALAIAIINMAEALGMSCVAEGIEDEDQLSFLRWNGCKTGQGYFFSRPLTATSMSTFLATYKPPRDNLSTLDFDAVTVSADNTEGWLAIH